MPLHKTMKKATFSDSEDEVCVTVRMHAYTAFIHTAIWGVNNTIHIGEEKIFYYCLYTIYFFEGK